MELKGEIEDAAGVAEVEGWGDETSVDIQEAISTPQGSTTKRSVLLQLTNGQIYCGWFIANVEP